MYVCQSGATFGGAAAAGDEKYGHRDPGSAQRSDRGGGIHAARKELVMEGWNLALDVGGGCALEVGQQVEVQRAEALEVLEFLHQPVEGPLLVGFRAGQLDTERVHHVCEDPADFADLP